MAPYRLSPYCVLYPRPDGAVLAHGLYGSTFRLSTALLRALVAVLDGVPLDAAVEPHGAGAQAALDMLIAERVLVDADGPEPTAGPDLFANRLDPLQLAFHRGFNEGGSVPARPDHGTPPPAVKDVRGLHEIALDTHPIPSAEMDLARCLAERRSIRSWAEQPLDRRALEQFLQLTARAYALLETPALGPISMRNYPSGGARYPLELYPVIDSVGSLEAGIYYYHPFHHRLTLLPSEAVHRGTLLDAARQRMGEAVGRGAPAVLFVITAVFARTCWKYTGIPYHLILQDVGALYQTMYLAATLLGLAPCAIGGFPELAVAELLGLDSRDEAQVGLFALGLPESAAGGRAPLAVVGVRLLDTSPFSPEPGRKGLELTFETGLKEILDLADLQLERSPAHALTCPVMRGRCQAIFNPHTEALLHRMLGGSEILP